MTVIEKRYDTLVTVQLKTHIQMRACAHPFFKLILLNSLSFPSFPTCTMCCVSGVHSLLSSRRPADAGCQTASNISSTIVTLRSVISAGSLVRETRSQYEKFSSLYLELSLCLSDLQWIWCACVRVYIYICVWLCVCVCRVFSLIKSHKYKNTPRKVKIPDVWGQEGWGRERESPPGVTPPSSDWKIICEHRARYIYKEWEFKNTIALIIEKRDVVFLTDLTLLKFAMTNTQLWRLPVSQRWQHTSCSEICTCLCSQHKRGLKEKENDLKIPVYSTKD